MWAVMIASTPCAMADRNGLSSTRPGARVDAETGKVEMAIDIGIAVAWEMFRCDQHRVLGIGMRAFDIRVYKFRHHAPDPIRTNAC